MRVVWMGGADKTALEKLRLLFGPLDPVVTTKRR
jgi:hypothetical protein